MYLNKISIKNFRVFDDKGIDVFFKKGVNAVIGENNNGKSALIDAIRIAFSAMQYRKDIYFNKSDFHVKADGSRAKTAEIDVYLKEVPRKLIELFVPGSDSEGEFHLKFNLDTTEAGIEKVKYKALGGKKGINTLSVNALDAINMVFLGALRNAENEMKPSRSSKLANLLDTVTANEADRQKIVKTLQQANDTILDMDPIQKTKAVINANLADIEQELLHQQIDIGLAEPRFEAIASSLRTWIVPRWYFIEKHSPLYAEVISTCNNQDLSQLVHECDTGVYCCIDEFLEKATGITSQVNSNLKALKQHFFELYQNGLGYNNLLFMSAVLGNMSEEKNGIELNLFAVEEPEAHLHPQLQELIHNFFERRHQQSSSIQVIYTSHSPTLVSRIGIDAINLLFENNHSVQCYPLSEAKLEDSEKNSLEKYLDVTKSQIFFAKGIIFVEGISEALLISEMAKFLGKPLDKYAVEVVNINGTSFAPFAKLLTLPSGNGSFAKAAIVTDDDRCTDQSDENTYISKDLDFGSDLTGIDEKLEKGTGSKRFEKLSDLCNGTNVKVFCAKKTFEYELSSVENNIPYMLEAIKEAFREAGDKLQKSVESEKAIANKALKIWLFIRRRDRSKAEIALNLCRLLQRQKKDIAKGNVVVPFVVPDYIAKAIDAVTVAKV